MSKKTNTIEESRISLQKFELVYGGFIKLVDAFKWVGIAYFAYNSINVLAGKITLADFNLYAVIKQEEDSSAPYILYLIILISVIITVISLWYGRREARLRKSTVQELTKHIAVLEIQIDPSRTSSLLTPRGDTAERDKR